MSQTAETREQRSPPQLKDAAFNWEDPLDLESELTEEERMVRDTARGFAQDKLFPRVLLDNREERFDRGIYFARWARSACSARPSRKNTAAPASATSPTG